jgi:ActR/RegA family two-component response regulator
MIHIQYAGFEAVANSRVYSFRVLEATREPREFTVRIQSDTNHWACLKLQDGPGICFERLEQELGRERPRSYVAPTLEISEQDIREYMARHYPSEKKAFGHREAPQFSPESPDDETYPHPAVIWRGLPESRADPLKEQITALLLYRPGNVLGLLQRALEMQSIQVQCMESCEDAWPLLRAANPPHLVFTEAKLPDGAWTDVVEHTLESPQPVKVIIVSRLVDVRHYGDTIGDGRIDFIAPPLSSSEVTQVVKSAVENVLDLRQAQSVTT